VSGAKIGCGAVLILLADLCAVFAQQTEPSQANIYAVFLGSPTYRDYLEAAINKSEPEVLRAGCPSLKLVVSNGYLPLAEAKFIKAGKGYSIDSGAWIAIAKLDRCGSEVIRRVLVKAVPGQNRLDSTPLLPGDFHGNLKLELDSRRIVFPALGAIAKCQDITKIFVIDIKSITNPSPQGWSETWTASACNKTVSAKVTYSGFPGGMNIFASDLKLIP
jgi:hypothetical protein